MVNSVIFFCSVTRRKEREKKEKKETPREIDKKKTGIQTNAAYLARPLVAALNKEKQPRSNYKS